MHCPSCGREAPEELFCEWCGKPLKTSGLIPVEAESTAPSDSKPPFPFPSPVVRLSASPGRGTEQSPRESGSHPGWRSIVWAALATALYVLIADAAIETFLHESPLRWWIAAGSAIYIAFCEAG